MIHLIRVGQEIIWCARVGRRASTSCARVGQHASTSCQNNRLWESNYVHNLSFTKLSASSIASFLPASSIVFCRWVYPRNALARRCACTCYSNSSQNYCDSKRILGNPGTFEHKAEMPGRPFDTSGRAPEEDRLLGWKWQRAPARTDRCRPIRRRQETFP